VRGLWQLVGANDTTPTLLARVDSGLVSQAVWSPDRTRIAMTYEPMDKSNQSRVVVVDADGLNWRNLSPDTISSSDPAWSKDGKAVLMAARDPKTSSVIRVLVDTRAMTVLASGSSSKFRYPSADTDSNAILVRFESAGQVDLVRVKAGAVMMLTNGKPREELIAHLRDGRVLLAVDSSSRTRPGTLQWVTVGTDQVQTPTPIRVPAGLVITDISSGSDDGSVIVVARVRSWPGASGPALVVLRVALDGADPKVLLLLNEKDFVTVRSD
jgi:dipeptidyl aminopeptidase/acylaminoacyl peptidase